MGILERIVALQKRAVLDLRIGTKVTLLYLLLLVVALTGSAFIFTRSFSDIGRENVTKASRQTLSLIETNLGSLFDNINDYAKMLLSNETIRAALADEDAADDVVTIRKVDLVLRGFMESMPQISAIYLYDDFDHRYGVDQYLLKQDRPGGVRAAPWFGDLEARSGAYRLEYGSGGLFEPAPEERYVSHVRIFNDIDSLEPIGVLVIHISCDAIAASFGGGIDAAATDVAVHDDAGHVVVPFADRSLDVLSPYSVFEEGEVRDLTLDGGRYLVTERTVARFGWRIVGATRIDAAAQDVGAFAPLTLGVAAFIAAVLFLGSLVVSRLVTAPVVRLERSMRTLEKGEFRPIPEVRRNDEIGALVRGYNAMVEEIRRLIRRTIRDQEEIRRAELQALQAQIKPHFLYNTFDAIASLAVEGDTARIHEVVRALGSYYRLSLSSGEEVITLRQEFDIVRNYLRIQQVRYGDLFTAETALDPSLEDVKVLKLVLQPLVENALYHGIKPLGSSGRIRAEAYREEASIVLVVEDNGVGMPPGRLAEVLEGPAGAAKGFGLRSTLERIGLFYGIAGFHRINSEPGKGTRIEIRIPSDGPAGDRFGDDHEG